MTASKITTPAVNPVAELRASLGVSRGDVVKASDGKLNYSTLARTERGQGSPQDLFTCRTVLTAYITDVERRLADSVKRAHALLATLPATAPATTRVAAAANTPTKKAAPAAKKTAPKPVKKATPTAATPRKRPARIESAKSS